MAGVCGTVLCSCYKGNTTHTLPGSHGHMIRGECEQNCSICDHCCERGTSDKIKVNVPNQENVAAFFWVKSRPKEEEILSR